MTCVELQDSLVENETGSSAEQQAHLRRCPECAKMVADLLVIACAAGDLRAEQEPHPRVWKSIEASLRREGLIRSRRRGLSLLPSSGSPWSWARWMAPAAALLLITLGIYLRQPTRQYLPETPPVDVPTDMAGLNDNDLLQEIAKQSPALQEQYADNLRRVNQYIQDAKNIINDDPNDEEALRSLMEAYQEKAMLFELALDRSLQ
jgi:transglutaminase-like putative cysteine protease